MHMPNDGSNFSQIRLARNRVLDRNKLLGFGTTILDMSDLVCQPTTGLIEWLAKSLWPTHDVTLIMSAINLSRTTV